MLGRDGKGSKFSRGAYRRPKTYKNIDLYTFLRAVRRGKFWGYIGGIYRVERDFGGIYRVAVYIGSKNIDIYTGVGTFLEILFSKH